VENHDVTRISNSETIEALRRNAGIIALAARDLGVTRQALEQRIKRSRVLTEVVRDVEESTLDIAEAGLKQAIAKGDAASIRFYLSTKGKRRGYTTRTEITGADGDPIDLNQTMENLTDEEAHALTRLAQARKARLAKP